MKNLKSPFFAATMFAFAAAAYAQEQLRPAPELPAAPAGLIAKYCQEGQPESPFVVEQNAYLLCETGKIRRLAPDENACASLDKSAGVDEVMKGFSDEEEIKQRDKSVQNYREAQAMVCSIS